MKKIWIEQLKTILIDKEGSENNRGNKTKKEPLNGLPQEVFVLKVTNPEG